MRNNRRAVLFCMLMLLALLCPVSSFAQNIRVVQIWNDSGNADGRRPADTRIILSSDERTVTVEDQEYHSYPDAEYAFRQSGLPDSYTAEGPFLSTGRDGLTAVFINTYKPQHRFAVQNELAVAELQITKKTDWETEEAFSFTLETDAKEKLLYTTSEGRSGIVAEGILLHKDETAYITMPVGTKWTVSEKESRQYIAKPVSQSGTLSRDGDSLVVLNEIVTTDFVVYKQ